MRTDIPPSERRESVWNEEMASRISNSSEEGDRGMGVSERQEQSIDHINIGVFSSGESGEEPVDERGSVGVSEWQISREEILENDLREW